jgi:Flp pilus assembly protein TadD
MYRRAIAADPMNPSALSNLAHLLHYARGSPDEAVVFYRRAIAADPSDSTALANLGYLHHHTTRDLEQAELCYRRCERPPVPARRECGCCCSSHA